MVTYAVPTRTGGSYTPLTRIDTTGVLESSAGFEAWWKATVTSGTPTTPTFVTLNANQRLNLTNGVDLGTGKNGVALQYVVFKTANPTSGRARLISLDEYPTKLFDKWGRSGVWTASGTAPDGHSYTTQPTFVFSGVDADGVDRGYADGGKYAPAAPYKKGYGDEQGFRNRDPRGMESTAQRLDPVNATTPQNPDGTWNYRATWTAADYEVSINETRQLNLANMNHTLVKMGGMFRCKVQHFLIDGANNNSSRYRENRGENFPFVNESQILVDLTDAMDCAVVDCELKESPGDGIKANSDRAWIGRSVIRRMGRDGILFHKCRDLIIEDTVIHSCGAQTIDNEPPDGRKQNFFPGTEAAVDGLWIQDVILGGSTITPRESGIYLDEHRGDFKHVCIRRVFSRDSDVAAGTIPVTGGVIQGSQALYGPESTSEISLAPSIVGWVIVDNVRDDSPNGSGTWMGFKTLNHVYVKNCRGHGDKGIKALGYMRNLRVETDCVFTDNGGTPVGNDLGGSPGAENPAYNSALGGFIYPSDPLDDDEFWRNDGAVAPSFWRDNDDLTVDTTAPATPTGLNATATAGGGAVDLDWNANSETDLDIYIVRWHEGDQLRIVEAPTSAYTWTGLQAGVLATFSVCARDTSGNQSAFSTSDTATPTAIGTAPATPTGLVVDDDGSGRLVATWDDDPNADDWDVEYRVAGSFLWQGTSNVTSPTKTFTGLTDDIEHVVRVRANNTHGTSAYAETTGVTVDTTAPATPTGLAVSPSVGDLEGSVHAQWDANSEPDLSHYRVQISTDPTFSGLFGFHRVDAPLNVIEFDGLVNGTTYYVRVAAVDQNDNISAFTAAGSATPTQTTNPPDAPTNVAATAGDARVFLTWDVPTDPPATSWKVFKQKPDGSYPFVAPTVFSNSFEYTGLSNGTPATFKVVAVNSVGTSPFSTPVTATPTATPTDPPPGASEPPPFLEAFLRPGVLVRTADLALIGALNYLSVEFVARHRAIGSWIVDVVDDGSDAIAALKQPGAGIAVVFNGQMVFAGPKTELSSRLDAAGTVLTVSGTDDLGQLADKRARPAPSEPEPTVGFYSQAYDVRSGSAEDVIKAYVDANAGPSAPPEYRIPLLNIEPSHSLGSAINDQARWEPLNEFIESLAARSSLGYRIEFDGQTMTFRVFEPEDKSLSAVFGAELGNVTDYDFKVEKPTCNHCVVLGGGEGAARLTVEVEDSDSIAEWGRVTLVRDARDVDPNEITAVPILQQRGQEELEKGKARYSFRATARTTDQLQWAPLANAAHASTPVQYNLDDDYDLDSDILLLGVLVVLLDFIAEVFDLGDLVSFLIDGERFTEVVREIHVTADANGLTVEPVVGTPDMGDPVAAFMSRLLERDREKSRRLTALETAV